jgi:hypothetical protein
MIFAVARGAAALLARPGRQSAQSADEWYHGCPKKKTLQRPDRHAPGSRREETQTVVLLSAM